MRKTIILATLMMGMAVLAEASSRCDKGVCQVAPDETQHSKTLLIKYGDMNQWVTRQVKESAIIGGQLKTLHEIAPTKTWKQNAP